MLVRITVRHRRPQLPRATPLLPPVRCAIRGPATKAQRLPRLRHLLADVEPRRQPRDTDVAEDAGRGEEHLVEQQAGAASEEGPHAPVNNGIAGFLRRIQPRWRRYPGGSQRPRAGDADAFLVRMVRRQEVGGRPAAEAADASDEARPDALFAR